MEGLSGTASVEDDAISGECCTRSFPLILANEVCEAAKGSSASVPDDEASAELASFGAFEHRLRFRHDFRVLTPPDALAALFTRLLGLTILSMDLRTEGRCDPLTESTAVADMRSD